MHIVIISRSYPNRISQASGNFVLNQVEALAKHDIKIGVVGVYNVSLKESIKKENIKKYGFYSELNDNVTNYTYLYPVLPKQHYLNHRIKFRIWKKLFKKYIKEHGTPDLIHLHTFEAGEIAIWIKDQFGIPYVVTEHTSLFSTNKAFKWHINLAVKVYSKSQLNIAVSRSSCSFLKSLFSQDFKYIPNFVDVKKFHITKSPISKVIQYVNIAYLNANKNQKLLIRAFDKAFQNSPKHKLKIIGNGEEYNNLINEINKLNNSNIELLGYLSQSQIIEHLQSSNYFVLSSNSETFGLVIIEAMSCGLPVLSTSCGGPESIIENEQLGLLSPVGNKELFANNLKKLYSTKYDPKFIRDYAANNYSFEVLSQKLINTYKEILK